MAENPSPQYEQEQPESPFKPANESCKMENMIDTVDHISLLPESIVHKILSNLLNSPKALVRMSILCKDWFSLTASFPILNFRMHDIVSVLSGGENFEWEDDYMRDAFFKNVVYTTSRFCKQNVSAHTLTIDTDLLEPIEVEIIKDCLESVLKKGVHVLKIIIDYDEIEPMLRLPNALLSAYALTSLTIHGCELPSSLMVDVVMFKSLKLLSMSRVPLDEGVIEYLTTSCPLLEEIYLRYCYGFTTFCVYRHHTLRKVQIFCDSGLEKINIEAPNLCYFRLENDNEKAACMNLASCNKLTTFCYEGSPLKSFSEFLSNFPIIENLYLVLTSPCNNIKLSSHSLRRFELRSKCDLEEIDINTPNLLSFEYYGIFTFCGYPPFPRKVDSTLGACMIWHPKYESVDTIWFQKLRRFLDKSNIFKVMDLILEPGSIDVEELKGIKSPPYQLEHVELVVKFLDKSPISQPILEAVLWCCRPRSLTLDLSPYTDKWHVVQNVYETLLQPENEGQINIQFVLFYSSGCKQRFSDLNSLLEALSLDQPICGIAFIKEEVVQEAG